jgi:hypothetical protein
MPRQTLMACGSPDGVAVTVPVIGGAEGTIAASAGSRWLWDPRVGALTRSGSRRERQPARRGGATTAPAGAGTPAATSSSVRAEPAANHPPGEGFSEPNGR